jgi:hypothetical protein
MFATGPLTKHFRGKRMGNRIKGALGLGFAAGFFAFKLNLGWFDAVVIGLIIAGSVVQLATP